MEDTEQAIVDPPKSLEEARTRLEALENFEPGQPLLEALREQSLKPDVEWYLAWLAKAETLLQGHKVLAEMQADALEPDTRFFRSLMAMTPVFQEREFLLRKMRAFGLEPDAELYDEVLTHAPTTEETRALLNEMRERGLTPRAGHYAHLIATTEDFTSGLAALRETQAQGFPPKASAYQHVLSLASHREGLPLLEEMKAAGFKPNLDNYLTLLHDAVKNREPLSAILSLLEDMMAQGVAPDTRKMRRAQRHHQPHSRLVKAVEEKIRRSKKPFANWAAEHYQEAQKLPPLTRDAWEAFFEYFEE